MSSKSRENWLIPLCLKKCAKRGKACKACLGYSEYKEFNTK